MKTTRLSILLLLSIFFGSCSSSKKADSNTNSKEKEEMVSTGSVAMPGPPVIVYKTKGDYYDKVPVILSEDKSKIVSYPAPSDLYRNGKPTLPDKLNGGYLLDNRGISKNVAFLNISYDKFSKLQRVFTTDQLYDMILDKDPLTEMYKCGKRSGYKDIVNELNAIIDSGKLDNCEKVK